MIGGKISPSTTSKSKKKKSPQKNTPLASQQFSHFKKEIRDGNFWSFLFMEKRAAYDKIQTPR
jgi:hypothetical protein